MELTFKVVMLGISLLVLVYGSVQGDIIFSITSGAQNPSDCIVDKELLVKVTCTITPSATTSVALIKDSTTYSDCDNTLDDCFPQESVAIPRYFFTSDYTKSEFTFNIGNVTFGTDDGIFECGVGGTSNSIEVDVCKPPEDVTITETGTEAVVVTATTDCVYPDTDVTVEWFYVPTSSNHEYALNATFARDSDVALCSHGSRHVKSSFNHTDAVENKVEVLFRCKVTHSAVTTTIVQDTTRKYFIEGTTTTTTTATTITTTTTTSSILATTTGISTSTTKMLVSILTGTSAVTASTTASSTVTSAKTIVQTPSASGDKALVTMIIVVSVIGGILIVAIFSIIFVMMHWKSCFTRRGPSKQYARRSDHRKQHRQAENNASGRFFTTRQDHAMRGYYFYNGTYNDPFKNSSYMNYYPNQTNSKYL